MSIQKSAVNPNRSLNTFSIGFFPHSKSNFSLLVSHFLHVISFITLSTFMSRVAGPVSKMQRQVRHHGLKQWLLR